MGPGARVGPPWMWVGCVRDWCAVSGLRWQAAPMLWSPEGGQALHAHRWGRQEAWLMSAFRGSGCQARRSFSCCTHTFLGPACWRAAAWPDGALLLLLPHSCPEISRTLCHSNSWPTKGGAGSSILAASDADRLLQGAWLLATISDCKPIGAIVCLRCSAAQCCGPGQLASCSADVPGSDTAARDRVACAGQQLPVLGMATQQHSSACRS